MAGRAFVRLIFRQVEYQNMRACVCEQARKSAALELNPIKNKTKNDEKSSAKITVNQIGIPLKYSRVQFDIFLFSFFFSIFQKPITTIVRTLIFLW